MHNTGVLIPAAPWDLNQIGGLFSSQVYCAESGLCSETHTTLADL